MSNVKKLMMTAAGGGGLNVEDVFSTYLYIGNNTTNTITNEIDLSTEGGLVWIKNRDTASGHWWIDTERGSNKHIYSNERQAEQTNTIQGSGYGFQSFNTDGFTLGTNYENENKNNSDLASWTFRKAPKFFDVVTYTGDGTSGRSISHNLGCDVGMIIIKNLSRASDWHTWHRGFTSTSYGAALNQNYAEFTNGGILTATPTSTTVTIKNPGYDGAGTNNNGDSYVMYLFAHNNSDGEFGPTGDQDIIKCGSYTYSNGLEVNLGFEPQWLLYKQSSTTGHWRIVDNMRGWGIPSTEKFLYPALTNAEAAGGQIDLTHTGFKVHDAGTGDYVYIAIRRGPMAVPDSATDVFSVAYHSPDSSGETLQDAGFASDMVITTRPENGQSKYTTSRFTDGRYLFLNNTNAEGNLSDYLDFDSNEGIITNGWWGNTTIPWWYQWKRAPNYFDFVFYEGSTTTPRTISHNLGVAPEMMWIRGRDAGGGQWYIYHKDMGNQAYGRLDTNDRFYISSDGVVAQTIWNATDPTASVFSLGNASNGNSNGQSFVAYLFASLDGVSKVGSYTGNGSASGQNIDCGFSSGARFVLIKTSSVNGSWHVWDSNRGIVAGNDPYVLFDNTDAEYTNDDYIDPYSAGFNVVSNMNVSSREYIFYAVA